MRVWPVVPYRGILSPFGASRDDGTRMHAGVDLGALPGDAIVSMDDGLVLYPVSGFGIGAGLQALAVRHPDAEYIYAEIGSPIVKPGDVLIPGQRIATAAKNGDGNSMLHLEAWEHAPKAFTKWVTGARPAGLLDVQARLPAQPKSDDDIIKEGAAALAAVRPGMPNSATQLEEGQAFAESRLGYGILTPDGRPSYNWGAIYADGDLGRVPFTDPVEGHVGAALNSSPVAGARQFVNLIEGSYSPALQRAYVGDAWGYARALWRDGPGNKRPSYYSGFPPGHKWGAPAGTPPGSPLDAWYRVRAYAQMVTGAAMRIAKALGQPLAVHLDVPPPPADLQTFKASSSSSSSGGGGVVLIAIAGLLGYVWFKS